MFWSIVTTAAEIPLQLVVEAFMTFGLGLICGFAIATASSIL